MCGGVEEEGADGAKDDSYGKEIGEDCSRGEDGRVCGKSLLAQGRIGRLARLGQRRLGLVMAGVLPVRLAARE